MRMMVQLMTNPDPYGKEIRTVNYNFYKLPYNKRFVVAGTLGLLSEEDSQLPDFRRVRGIMERAMERQIITQFRLAVEAELRSCGI